MTEVEQKIILEIDGLLLRYVTSLEAVEIRDGLRCAMEISRIGNQYLTDNKLDNSLFENERARCGTLLTVSVNIIYFLASLLYPYMPSSSESILKQLHAPVCFSSSISFSFSSSHSSVTIFFSQLRRIDEKFTLDILPGHVIGTPALLFSRIEEKEAAILRERYKGKQEIVESVTAAAASSKKVKKTKAPASSSKDPAKQPANGN